MEISAKRCMPCEGGVLPLDAHRVGELLRAVPGWKVSEDRSTLTKGFRFSDFAGTMGFVIQMAAIAEEEGHHPDFCVRYDRLDVQLSTHSIRGLSENDFIIAAKLDKLASSNR